MVTDEDFLNFVKSSTIHFEVIFNQYYQELVSFSMSYDAMQNEAEDIAIEVFYNTWKMRNSIKSPASLDTLLYLSVRNKSLNVIRNNKTHKRIIEQNITFDIDNNGLKEYIIEEEVLRMLDNTISKLPPQAEQVIHSLFEGKTVVEVAKIINISESSVKIYRQQAINVLRKQVHVSPIQVIYIMSKL